MMKYKNRLSVKEKILRAVWTVSWCVFAQWLPRCRIASLVRKYFMVLFGAKIGRGCGINQGVRIWAPWNLEMSDYASLGPRVNCYNVAKIVIGSHATISMDAFLCSASHDIGSAGFDLIAEPILIGDAAWVCARAIVMPGVRLGEGSVVAAGAVVTKNIDPWTVVGGNPSNVIKKRVLKND